ncbi:uncharacterized protein LOC120392353 [Mauremys reevesii]|uniref:uncharacterized protein LOC120392353 n=1 Tax=Mauremys reevesii TaxID=260615 RepID=UPI00193EF110|nr:uncharacterized protein LOC120392353 [Mauremys reevesii]
MSHSNRRPHYHVAEPTGDVYLVRLLYCPQPLSMETLQSVRDALETQGLLDEELGAGFERALAEFPREPPCVQNNAEMVIQSDETELTFLSGKGKYKIRISDNGACYEVKEPTARVFLARLKSHPQKLSTETLQGVRDALEKWGLLDEELGAGFEQALAEFPREPRCVQRNARMVIRHDRTELVFVSGQGECEITVSEGEREPCYEVKEPTVTVYQERLRSCPQRLSAGNLERIRDRLESWGVMTKELRRCFNLLLRKFPQEPECIRDNPRMCVAWDETKLRLVSEDGDCEVSVTCCDGKPSYEVKVKSWEMYRERMRRSEQPLSIESLAGVRGEVRGLSGAPEKVKEALNVAVRGFSAEPSCLQKNARLVIECDRGEMVFVSGKGENKVDVSIIDGKVSYNVRATTWVTFLRVFQKLLPKIPEALLKFIRSLVQFLLFGAP